MTFEWSQPYPWWVYVLMAVLVAAALGAARHFAISPRLRGWTLFVPRMFVLAILLIILLNPVHRRQLDLPAEPPHVALLVDNSRSMGLDEPLARIDQAKQAIGTASAALGSEGSARLQLFRFGTNLSAAAELGQLGAYDDASRLEDALARLQTRFGNKPPRAVVVFSDGAVESDFDPSVQASLYRRLHVPVHVYPVGSADHMGDVAIEELVVPRRSETGSRVTIRAVLRSQGFTGQRIVASVRGANRPDGEALVQLPLTLSDGPQPLELVFENNPDFGQLVLEIPPLPGEAITRNNRVPFTISSADRKIKVIYMEGTGSNEYHWVQDALMEDKDIQCLSMVADHQYVQRPRLMRVGDVYKGFPATREELLEYDCVICSDISLGAFTREQLDWTVELVAQRGGGFAMVGGITSFAAGGWDQTAWDQLIPVDMRGDRIGQGWLYHAFSIRIPDDSLTHPIWRIAEDADENRRALASIPAFYGTNFIQRLKPAATTLAMSATPLPHVGIMPVIAVQPYGRGRTLAFASDTTVDWGRDFESRWGAGDNRYFRRFWRNVVRWLTENSAAGNRRLQVETDRIIYRPGQPIEIATIALDESLRETTAYELTAQLLAHESPASGRLAITLQPAPDGKSYQGQLDTAGLFAASRANATESTGLLTHTIEIVARHQGQELARTTVDVQLLHDSAELRALRARPETLEQLATAAGGQVLRAPRELAQLLRDLPKEQGEVIVTRSPVWDHPLLWTLIFVLLCTEWILRRITTGRANLARS